MTDFSVSVLNSLGTFAEQLKYAFLNPSQIVSNYSAASVLIIFIFFITRRFPDLFRVMMKVYKESLLKSNQAVVKQLFENVLVRRKDEVMKDDENSGSILIEYFLFLVIFTTDFWKTCKEKQSNQIKIENSIQQGIVTVLPLLGLVYFMNIFVAYREKKRYRWLGDILEGLLLFFLYNFAMNFREIHQYNVCAIPDTNEVISATSSTTTTVSAPPTDEGVSSGDIDMDYERSRWISSQWDPSLTANYQNSNLNMLYGGGSGGGGSFGGTGGNYGGTGGLYSTPIIPPKTDRKQTIPDEETTTTTATTTTAPSKPPPPQKTKSTTNKPPPKKTKSTTTKPKSTQTSQPTAEEESTTKTGQTIFIIVLVLIVIIIVTLLLYYYMQSEETSASGGMDYSNISMLGAQDVSGLNQSNLSNLSGLNQSNLGNLSGLNQSNLTNISGLNQSNVSGISNLSGLNQSSFLNSTLNAEQSSFLQ